jgi:hypothetical protein
MNDIRWHWFRRSDLWIAVILVVLAAATRGWSAPKSSSSRKPVEKTKPDASDPFFTNGPIPYLKIQVGETNLAVLRTNNRNYVPATVQDGDTVYEDVGIHLKGAAGSFRGLEDKPALTLNFTKFKSGQRFYGLDKIHLNNSVQDPSYMTELLCGELFRAANVPAARTTHARVEFNGRDLGLFVLKEGFDKTFLRRYFKNPNGNLYDGGFLREITEPLQKICGDETNDYAPLKALAVAANETNAAVRWSRLEKALDMDRFLSFMAVDIMAWDWDGYAMKRNNYRVYHEPTTDKIVFFPHGMDQMFWVPDGPIFPGMEGLVAKAVVTTPEGKRRYRECVGTLFTNVFRIELLTNRISQVQARIRPALADISPDDARNHDGAVNHLRDEVVQRITGLRKLISLPDSNP